MKQPKPIDTKRKVLRIKSQVIRIPAWLLELLEHQKLGYERPVQTLERLLCNIVTDEHNTHK